MRHLRRRAAASKTPSAKEEKPTPSSEGSPWGESKEWGKATGWEGNSSAGPASVEEVALEKQRTESTVDKREAEQVRLRNLELTRKVREMEAQLAELTGLSGTVPNLQVENESLKAENYNLQFELNEAHEQKQEEDQGHFGNDDAQKLAKAIAVGMQTSKKESGYRIGNVAQKVPTIKEVKEDGKRPGVVMAEKLQALALFEKDLAWYLSSCLFTEDREELAKQARSEARKVHTEWVHETIPGQARFGILSIPEVRGWDTKTIEFLNIAAGLLYERAPEGVRNTVADLERASEAVAGGEGPSTWQRFLVTLVASHREFNVRWPKQVTLLEEIARKPFVSTPQAMRLWWIASGSATELGHVSWRQIAEGLVDLTDRWENWDVLAPRELRQLGTSIDNLGLSRFGVEREQVTEHYLLMLATLQQTQHKSKRKVAHVALNFEDVLDEVVPEGDDTGAIQDAAWFAKGKGKGQPGQRKGQSDGCFNCGSADHWSRECPEPKREGKGPGKGSDKGNKKGGTPACRNFARAGKCSYGDKCCFTHNTQNPKPKKKAMRAALDALVKAFEGGSEGDDDGHAEQGNGDAPPQEV